MATACTNPVSVRWLDSAFISNHVPMQRAIELMGDAFAILSVERDCVPARVVMTTPDNSMALFFKPAFLQRYGRMSIKVLTQILADKRADIATIKGIVLLVDMTTGQFLSLADGNRITALRTGAASGIATRLLANPDASSVAIFGCGAQGLTQLEAMLAVRPIRRICLFDTNVAHAADLALKSARWGSFQCEINPGLAVLSEMDIICTATPSNTPLFSRTNIKPGVHINAVGSYRTDMQELDPEIFRDSRIFLDDAPACIEGSGDLVVPIRSGILDPERIAGEIGGLISGRLTGRTGPLETTIFKSVGNAIQDFFMINEAYEISLTIEGIPVLIHEG